MATTLRFLLPALLLSCLAPRPARADDPPAEPDHFGNYVQVGALPLSFWSTKSERKAEGQPVEKADRSGSRILAVEPSLAFRAGIGSFVGRAELLGPEGVLQLGYRLGHLELGFLLSGEQSTNENEIGKNSSSNWLLGPYAIFLIPLTASLSVETEGRLFFASGSDETTLKTPTRLTEAINRSGLGFGLAAQLVVAFANHLEYCPSLSLVYLSGSEEHLPVDEPGAYVGDVDVSETGIRILPLAVRFRF